MWLRWRGPFGLAWQQRVIATRVALPILPDIRALHERGARIFERHALSGLLAQIDRGDGTDFDALVEYRSGRQYFVVVELAEFGAKLLGEAAQLRVGQLGPPP